MTLTTAHPQLHEQLLARHRPPYATWVVLGLFGSLTILMGLWFSGEMTLRRFFSTLAFWQANTPAWLSVTDISPAILIGRILILGAIIALIRWRSPQPVGWSRLVVVGFWLALTVNYILWRSLTTLNVNAPLNGLFSLALFLSEASMLLSGSLQMVLLLGIRDRKAMADQLGQAVADGSYQPSVDIFIPTYNEPAFILRRSLMGAQAIDYPHKTIYVLDDGHRPEIRELAKSLGCQYLSRRDRQHAKAGNLNDAIAQTAHNPSHQPSELIAIFDADFIPAHTFLSRTVGFFQCDRTGLVQTPQNFYNSDPISRNLGWEKLMPPDEEVFYRHLQPIRDGVGSVVCAGTSFVVRRSALEEVGGFDTDSLCEDYFTGIRISALRYDLIYLNEPLSVGLAAEDVPAYVTQRVRWARGTLQAFFIPANPLTVPGLSFMQRLGHFEGLLHYFNSIARMILLWMPVAYAFLGIIPIDATAAEVWYFFVPFYLVHLGTYAWLNQRSRAALTSDLYWLILAFPMVSTIIRTFLHPFSQRFQVTPKGLMRDRPIYRWGLALPLIGILLASLLSLGCHVGVCPTQGLWPVQPLPELASAFQGTGLGWVWSIYTSVTLILALQVLRDVPQTNPYPWFARQLPVKLAIAGQHYCGYTTELSEVGAIIKLDEQLPDLGSTPDVKLIFPEGQIKLPGHISRSVEASRSTYRIQFESLNLEQERYLVEKLFCQPGLWKRQQAPGERASLWLICKTLLRIN